MSQKLVIAEPAVSVKYTAVSGAAAATTDADLEADTVFVRVALAVLVSDDPNDGVRDRVADVVLVRDADGVFVDVNERVFDVVALLVADNDADCVRERVDVTVPVFDALAVFDAVNDGVAVLLGVTE